MNALLDRPRTFHKSAVADLSVSQIQRMKRNELVTLIRELEPPFLSGEMLKRIEDRDRSELERILFLCRRCCRQQGY